MSLSLISSAICIFSVEETLLSVLLSSPVDPALTKQSEAKHRVASSNHFSWLVMSMPRCQLVHILMGAYSQDIALFLFNRLLHMLEHLACSCCLQNSVRDGMFTLWYGCFFFFYVTALEAMLWASISSTIKTSRVVADLVSLIFVRLCGEFVSLVRRRKIVNSFRAWCYSFWFVCFEVFWNSS